MRLNLPSFTALIWLRLDVVVAVRRQNDQILDGLSARSAEEESHAADALQNLELSVEADFTDTLLNMDAVEVCGPPLKKHLDNFDAPCPKGRFQGGPLKVITSGIGQEQGPFRLPDRLYVCNPNSKLKGALFKQGESPKAITSSQELESTMKTLFAEKLFKWVTSWPHGMSHRRNGEEKNEEGKPKKIMLWVLDMAGNWIIGPEVQEGGLVVKHGDFTPGEYPWKRPELSFMQDLEQAPMGDENLPIAEEKRLGGNYRGLARAGGEIHFPPEPGTSPGLALIEDSSCYAFWRANVSGSESHGEMAVEEVEEYIQRWRNMAMDAVEQEPVEGIRDPPIHKCAMKRLKEYLQGPVGLSLSGAKIMVRILDPKTKADFYVDP